MCRCVVGCLVVWIFLFLFGVFVAHLFVTFAGRNSGSWYCGFRLGATEDNAPIGEAFMFQKLKLTVGSSGKLMELSISPKIRHGVNVKIISLRIHLYSKFNRYEQRAQ